MPIPRRADHGRASTRWTALTLVLFAIALAIPATAAAAPTANFTISPASPHQGQAVTYTSTGTCDVAPCTNRWYHPEEFATGVAQPRNVVSFTYVGTPGVRTVQLTVRNANGVSSSVTRSFTLLAAAGDTTAPNTTITFGPSNPTTSTSASVAFNSSETGSTFACRSDGGAYAACTSPKAYSAMAMGAHSFSVRATDAAGNVDASPATWSWTIKPPAADTTPPDTTITSGPADPTTSTSASLGFNSSETGSTFACSTDAGAYVACTSAASYSALAMGAHSFSVRATDAAGNVDPSPATWSWTINPPAADTTAPTTTITSAPSSGTSTSASASFTGADNVAVTRFECRLDAGAYATCTSPKAYSALAAGSHTFDVRAYDAAGNVDGTPATATWTISSSGGGTLNGWDMNATTTGFTGTLTTQSPSQLPGVTCSGSNCNVTVAGTTISNVDISGSLGILASNVTISNSRIRGEVRVGRSIGGGGDTNVSNTRITHSEFVGGGTYEAINVVGSTNGLWDFNNIHGYENSITEWTGTKDSIINNYIWGDSNAQSGGHIDGLEIYGVQQGMTITGNYVVMTQSSNATAPLNLTPTGHFDGTITVNNNVFGSANCGYVILGDDSQGSTPIIATINNNRLSRSGSNCGYFDLRHNQGGSTYTGSGNVDGNMLSPLSNPS